MGTYFCPILSFSPPPKRTQSFIISFAYSDKISGGHFPTKAICKCGCQPARSEYFISNARTNPTSDFIVSPSELRYCNPISENCFCKSLYALCVCKKENPFSILSRTSLQLSSRLCRVVKVRNPRE